ncbi:lipocalin family protein [Curvibacter sp. HBC61]|uniref:Outer membrane lipoprotein Blc n=1 Tax=Curvibacter cyanobacteriorum TaxID=3026422 RepID=A0ABT5N2Q9_9BURK|nr:lipocalin family protein [Curvibacter sp. HBC61]MDD0839951.1 lipocalin family protein [Curvibacter sp. HBC61]
MTPLPCSPWSTRLAAALLLAASALAPAAHAAGAAAPNAAPAPLQTVARLELPRYLGTWYEIAKYPNRFQQKCVADTRADYQMRADGQVRVLNQCRRADGSTDSAEGAARLVGGTDSPRLQVRFAPAWLGWLPAVWGDYWVIDLEPAYQLVAVSEPQREFLWVLSRQPQVDPQAYQALLQRLIAQGFDPARLQWTPHGDTPVTRPGTP